MAGLRASLFGKFRIEQDGRPIETIEAHKAQELLGYLCVYRQRPQPREYLSELLWKGQPPAKSKKYLRHTLWKLKTALEVPGEPDESCLLLVDPEWIQLNISQMGWLDIAEFERAFDSVKKKRAEELSGDDFRMLERTVDLYQGGLLEGWYQDWCLLERERYQTIYLMLLSKLVQYCEAHQLYDAGLAYGGEILRRDRAYELAHRRMMRLYFMADDRTQAIRQYERCVVALREDLGLEPSERTRQLYEQIKADHLQPTTSSPLEAESEIIPRTLKNTLERLDHDTEAMTLLQSEIQKEILAIHQTLQI
jgi:DNA-binding SARP family transcriptional activator